jgi:sialic acid synthase SpsE
MEDIIKPIQLGAKKVGPGNPVFIVAEVANCHEGNFETAKKMIELIQPTGVDAVKFQLHIPAAEMTKSHPKFTTQGKRSLSIEQLAELKRYAESLGLYFLCTPFSRQAADQLESIGVDAFKIGSGETSDFSFIEYVAKKGKPMILSTGMTEWNEIEEVVKILNTHRTPFMLLQNVSMYPSPYEKLNLKVIPKLRQHFKVPVGLSDHTTEIYSAIAAVALGAHFIEKHYTLDRNQQGTTDHTVSLEPQEWAMLVDAVRKIERAMGSDKQIISEEQSVISWARHGVVALKKIPQGTLISIDMLTTKRPLYGAIHAKDLPKVIGRTAKKDILEDELIGWADVA